MQLEAEATMRTLKKDNSAMKDEVDEMEDRVEETAASARRSIEQASQRANLAVENLKKCKDDLRRIQQDLGYKRSALNRAQEMNSEYEAELRELRTLKETSRDADLLKRELSGITPHPACLSSAGTY
jgi:chromosome segregation ATPase